MNHYLSVLKKYAVFNGRSSRSEYWFFALFNTIILFILSLVDVSTGTYNVISNYGVLSGLYLLAILIPSIAVGVRRLHDIDKSGWMILVSLIPFIGWIWIFILMVTDSTPGENKYGPNPKLAHHNS